MVKFELYINPNLDYNNLKDDLQISLRQAYADVYFDKFDLRVGKQQIIWGKADGVFITDVISPRDLTEFILPDFEEVRMGVNAVKLDYYIGNSTLEVVWLPTFQPTVLPDSSSIWFPNTNNFIQPVQIDNTNREVTDKFTNSKVGIKYSYLGSSLDYELIAAYIWDDNPAQHMHPQPDDSILIKPQHHRLPLAGVSLGKSVLGAVIRSEAAYYFDKKFAAQDMAAQGIAERDYIHYLVGYDHSWWGANVSWQFIQEYIMDYSAKIINDEYTSTITFQASNTYHHEKIEVSFLGYYGINEQDALVRPKVSYELSSGLNLRLGIDLFYGEGGNFGQYDQNDMVYMKLRYDF
ncbi:MAG: DUF1302 family protein [Candidatus Cloacimonadota bacterium]|nr:DUF1302 family protein [Candidatus Cloacimonadota bacterium]